MLVLINQYTCFIFHIFPHNFEVDFYAPLFSRVHVYVSITSSIVIKYLY